MRLDAVLELLNSGPRKRPHPQRCRSFQLRHFNALMGLSCYRCRLLICHKLILCFNALMGLSCYDDQNILAVLADVFQCPHGLELLLTEFWQTNLFECFNALMGLSCYWNRVHQLPHPLTFQCPHGLELLRPRGYKNANLIRCFNALMGLSCYWCRPIVFLTKSMFQCPHGLELLRSLMPPYARSS